MNLNKISAVPLQSMFHDTGSRLLIAGKRKPIPLHKDEMPVKKRKLPNEKPFRIPQVITKSSALTSEDRELQNAQLERHQLKKLMEKNMKHYKKALVGNPLYAVKKRPSNKPVELSFNSKKQISHKKQLSLKGTEAFLGKKSTKSKNTAEKMKRDDFDLLTEKLLACSLSSKKTVEEAKSRPVSKNENRKESLLKSVKSPKPLTLLTEFSRNILGQSKSGTKTFQHSFIKPTTNTEMARSSSKSSFSILGSFKSKAKVKDNFDRENKENVYRFNY